MAPSLGRGAADCEVAGRGNCDIVETPTSSFPKEGIAHGPAFFCYLILLSITSLLLPSCRPDNIQEGAKLQYFDLKGYFTADTARLNKLTQPISKTVSHNKAVESKKVIIKNWGNELGLFFASDINKPAWRESYTIQNTDSLIVYRAKFPELKTREIVIKKTANKVKWILIYNSTKNMLYQTTEKLSYFPDSAYVIVKYQKVRLLGANNYKITGTFN